MSTFLWVLLTLILAVIGAGVLFYFFIGALTDLIPKPKGW